MAEPVDRYPFRRTISADPYSTKSWILGQYSGFADAASTNRRFKTTIAAGQQGLSIALDLPTQLGLDPDHPLAVGEVGRVGVSLACLDDLEALFDGIPLNQVRQISCTANSIGPMIMALFVALARRRGVPLDSFSLRLQNDVLKEYVARGTQFLPVEPALRFAVDAVEFSARNAANWVPMSVAGYHMRDAGGSRAQELGFTLANARAYIVAAMERGETANDVAKSLAWFLSASSQPIHEAAKFRAARELWATTLRDDFGVTDDAALRLRISAYTLGSEMSPFEIPNNSVRITLAALGAVLGGVQMLFCSSIDEAVSLPTDSSALLSLRTQQIILEESEVPDHVDILGGAPEIERITDELLASAREVDAEVTEQGGAVAAISSGWMRSKIDDHAWELERARRDRPRVGETADRPEPPEIALFSHTASLDDDRREAFLVWQAGRDAAAVDRALVRLKDAVERRMNLVGPLADAFAEGVSLGEAAQLLVDEYGAAPGRTVTAGAL